MRGYQRLRSTLLVIWLPVALVACGGGDDGGGSVSNPESPSLPESDATVTVTGADELTYSDGAAVLSVIPETSQYSIALVPRRDGQPDLSTRIQLHGRGSRPATGTYVLSDQFSPTAQGASVDSLMGNVVLPGSTYTIDAGTLTITASSTSRVEGTASFTAFHSLSAGQHGSVTVEASFVALCNWTGAPSC